MSHKQYEVLEVLEAEKKLKIKDYATGEEFTIDQSDAKKAKRKNQGELIKSYLLQYSDATTEEVLKETGLSNPIYVNKLRKKMRNEL